MKFKSFYEIYYAHRLKKAKFFNKIYILTTLPLNYFINKILFQKTINLDLYQKKNIDLFNMNLNSLFKKFNSDKGEQFINQYQKPIYQNKDYINGHEYHLFYEKFLKDKKEKDIKVLELGSFKGNATAAFFFYFKNASFFSGDLYPDFFCYKSSRIKNFLIDTSSRDEIEKKILNNEIFYDLIIEDAGHYLKDQIISLFMCFKKLNSGGVFVIEELDFPDTRKDMNTDNEKPTLKEILNKILEDIDFFTKYITKEEKLYFLQNFKDIHLFKGRFNEIAFITKK